jgi:hypothetical protein
MRINSALAALHLPLKPLTLKPETIKPTRWRLLPIEQAFKISAGGGESQGSSSSIYIGSTESAKQKVGTLVIGKNDLAIDKDGIVDLDIGRGFIV